MTKQEKSAKEMFEELGYKQITRSSKKIHYANDISLREEIIFFLKTYKYGYLDNERYEKTYSVKTINDVSVELNKAINKQIEEMGWE